MFNERLNSILLVRRLKLAFKECEGLTGQNYSLVSAIAKNIEAYGFTFSKELFEYLSKRTTEELKQFYFDLTAALKEMTGANYKYEPFYKNFPDLSEYSDWDLVVNALIHYFTLGQWRIDEQVKERIPCFDNVDLKVINLGTEDDLIEIRDNLIKSKTSLSEQDKKDMVQLISVYRNNFPEEIPFKENIVIIAELIIKNIPNAYWYECLHPYFKTATDVLRFATKLSNGDISLANNTKYRSFKRVERALLLHLLDNCNNIEEDMVRYKNQWIRLGERLHPGDYFEYKKVRRAFSKLRDNEYIETFNSRLEHALAHNNVRGAVDLLKNRPGEFARRLDILLSKTNQNKNEVERDFVLQEFYNVAADVSTPVLLQVIYHFLSRKNAYDSRIFFPKGNLTKAFTVKNEMTYLEHYVCDDVIAICQKAIMVKFKEKESLGKIYISPSIHGYVVPQSQRSASAGMKIITRCSKFPVEKDFIRLFIRWENEVSKNGYENRTDIDLSCTFLNEDFGYVDHISYTHLRNRYSTHSGDITNAPREQGGATEFIDINIKQASNHARYAIVQVYGFTQSNFKNLDGLLAGWMEMDDLNTGEAFEPMRVQNKVNLTNDTYCSLPMLFDLKTKEVMWLDLGLTTQASYVRNVEANLFGVALTVKGLVQSVKPQMHYLAWLNAVSRGYLTEDRNDADIIFDTNTEKPKETVKVVVQDQEGNVIEERTEERVKEDVRIITPFDIDYWMSEML